MVNGYCARCGLISSKHYKDKGDHEQLILWEQQMFTCPICERMAL